MRLFNFGKQLFLSCNLILLSLPPLAAQKAINTVKTDKEISQIYYDLNGKSMTDISSRLDWVSAKFLGKSYLVTSLGEGIQGRYDQFPLYRTDVFDCETYVDTVLALALSNNPTQFKSSINHVRYHNGHVSFVERNHFTCLDWNQNNQNQGFVKDITTSFRNQQHQPVSQWAKALINKPSWYAHMTTKNIRLSQSNPDEQARRLEALKREGSQLGTAVSTIPYIPLSLLFDKNGKPNQFLFHQIPNAAIVEIVRPNWDLNKEIGTHLNVSHLGFVFWKNGILYFRQASSVYNGVVEVPLIEYLAQARKSPTIKGINVQTVLSSQTK